MEKIWIIGVGQFGHIAFERLSRGGRKDRQFILVDPKSQNLHQCQGPNALLEATDGVAFLHEHLGHDEDPDWIIPALPIHLTAEWLLLHSPERLRRIPLPAEMEPLLSNPMRGPEGNIYVSHADFRCPDDCAEPKDLCTVTGQKRKQNMFEILAQIRFPGFTPLSIRSHQLGPGIGGYRPRQLFSLLHAVEQARGALLVSTACRCHGVVTGLEMI